MDKLNEKRIDEFKSTFRRADRDNDGKLTMKELETIMMDLAKQAIETELHNMSNGVDNKTIDVAEFIKVMDCMNIASEAETKMKKRFRHYDADNNGHISKAELMEAMKNYNMSESDIDDMMNDTDKDRDTNIDYEEFVGMMLN